MTNSEKYLKDGVDLEGLSNDIESYIKFYGGFDTKEFFEDESWCNQSTKATPTLTEDERAILRNIPKEYTKIRRNEWQEIEFVHNDCRYRTCYLLSHLFQFIKERRRIPY